MIENAVVGAGGGATAALAATNPWLMPLLIGGSTLASIIQGEEARKSAQKMRAAEMRAQPWTGNAPSTQVKPSNIWGALAQGATAAGMAHAGSQQQAADNQFRSDVLGTMKASAPAQALKTAAESSVTPMMGENPMMNRTDYPDYLRTAPGSVPMQQKTWLEMLNQNQQLDPRFQSILSG